MREYHQPYSEIENMPLEETIFYVELVEALAFKKQQEFDKLKKNRK